MNRNITPNLAYDNSRGRVAKVDKFAYRRDIERYERDYRKWIITRKIFEPFTALNGVMVAFMSTATDETGAPCIRALVATIVFFAFTVIGAKILSSVKKPAFPEGVMLIEGEYVYTTPVVHKGLRTVLLNRTYVYDEVRRCKILSKNGKSFLYTIV